MNGLKEQFGSQIEFIDLDIDDASTLPMRQRYNIVRRTNYVLLDASGQEVSRWFGPLDEEGIVAQIQEFLGGQ